MSTWRFKRRANGNLVLGEAGASDRLPIHITRPPRVALLLLAVR